MREVILNRIRAAVKKNRQKFEIVEPDLKASVFRRPDESLPEMFAKEFNKINGRFIYCKNDKDFRHQYAQLVDANNWSHIYCTEEHLFPLLNETGIRYQKNLTNYTKAEVGITSCEALAARTGSIIAASGPDLSRTLSIFPQVHIVLAYYDQLFYDIENAFNYLKDKYNEKYPSMISIISGPSRTADIEKTLVLGAHGPKDLYCFYINEK